MNSKIPKIAIGFLFFSSGLLAQNVDFSAFEGIAGAQQLNDKYAEINDTVIPIIGFGESIVALYGSGVNFSNGSVKSFASYKQKGIWYTQSVNVAGATFIVEGEAQGGGGTIADELQAPAGLATIDNPDIQFLFDDRLDTSNKPIEVIASFRLGGAFYRVTIMCQLEKEERCQSDLDISQLIKQMEILEREAAG